MATVLFADLSGYTAVSERMDPEDVKSLVDGCLRRLGEEVTRYGGTVDKYIGDNVMAIFGAPVAHEDDAERAVRAASAILDSVHGLGLEARIGVEAGEVVADETESTFATGEAVNVAAFAPQMAAFV